MAHKVFVSYKYRDQLVAPINGAYPTTARHYVDKIIEKISDVEIYKGEEDGEDMSTMSNDYIWNSLKKKIKDSSVTIVLISKGMKTMKPEDEQWIPLEVSYSLKEIRHEERVSRSNGLLAVVLPDENGLYDHYFQYSGCPQCGTVTHKTERLFEILRNNMFNRKQPKTQTCLSTAHSTPYHTGNDHSYINQVRWDNFIADPSRYVQHAADLRDRISEFNIQKVPVLQTVQPTAANSHF